MLRPLRMLVVSVVASSAVLGAQAGDPIMGTWKLNVAKSTYSPDPPPKSSTHTYELYGQEGVKFSVEGVDAAGNRTSIQYTAYYDGKDYPVTGSSEFDTVALRRIDAYTTELVNKKAGKVVYTRTRVLSKDGQVLTITSRGTNPKGQAVNNVAVFEKQ